MMALPFYLLTTASLLSIVQCDSYQPVQFVKNNDNTDRYRRHTGYFEHFDLSSYQFFKTPVSVWFSGQLPITKPNIYANVNHHVTPDFSNGLEYPDPLLLIGLQAKRAAEYLYSKELFFEDIPHVRALLRNQEIRRANGLAGNQLGSLRPTSPFHRYNKNRIYV